MMHFQVGWLAGSCWLVISNLCLIFHSTWCFWLRLCLEYFLIGRLKQIYNDWGWGMSQVAALPTLRLNIFSSLQINVLVRGVTTRNLEEYLLASRTYITPLLEACIQNLRLNDLRASWKDRLRIESQKWRNWWILGKTISVQPVGIIHVHSWMWRMTCTRNYLCVS